MRALVAASAIGLLLLLAPLAAAEEEAEALCIIFIQPMADFRTVEINADLILSPEQRTNLSERVDLDADGNITSAEVATFENGSRVHFDGATVPAERALSLDGRAMTSLDVSTKLRNWTGPREEAQKGVVTELRTYAFDASELTYHILEGALYTRPLPPTYQGEVVIEVIVIDAPREWVIERITQVDANGTVTNESFPEAPNARLSGFDLSRGSVTFRNTTAAPSPIVTTPTSPVHPSPIPGASALLVTSALAFGALVASGARRRRQG